MFIHINAKSTCPPSKRFSHGLENHTSFPSMTGSTQNHPFRPEPNLKVYPWTNNTESSRRGNNDKFHPDIKFKEGLIKLLHNRQKFGDQGGHVHDSIREAWGSKNLTISRAWSSSCGSSLSCPTPTISTLSGAVPVIQRERERKLRGTDPSSPQESETGNRSDPREKVGNLIRWMKQAGGDVDGSCRRRKYLPLGCAYGFLILCH